jgi:ribosomal protein L13E
MAQTVVNGASMAFRSGFRELILPIPTEGPLIQDGWIALMISAVAAVAFIDRPLIKYRQHQSQQMGARRTSTTQRVMQAQKTASNAYLAEAAQFQQACDRLRANNGHSASEQVLSMMRDKITHLQARAALPSQKLRRVAPVLREVFNRRYYRYSRGLFSAAKDLLV